MDKLESMKAFVTVADTGSFAAAARKLGNSRSQVNRQVIQLEESLGISLFRRSTRETQLTATGEEYLAHVRNILAAIDGAEAAVQQENEQASGDIRLNAPLSFGVRHLTPILLEFMRAHPKMRVSLNLSDERINPLSDGVDFTLRIGARSEPGSLIAHELCKVRRPMWASPSLLKRIGRLKKPADLRDVPCLHYGHLARRSAWQLISDKVETQVKVQGALCSNNGDVLLAAAIAGEGVVMLPEFIAGPAQKVGHLVRVLPEYRGTDLVLTLLYGASRYLPQGQRAFIRFLIEQFPDIGNL